MCCWSKREEHLHHAGEDKSKETGEQERTKVAKILALLRSPKGITSQRRNHCRGQNQCLKNNFPIGVSTGNSNGEANRHSEKPQQNIIMRMLLLIPHQRNQKYKGKEDEEQEKRRIALKEKIKRSIENGYDGDDGG